MATLWETLTTGLIVSLVFILISYFFWKRYDKPTPLMLEREEEKQRIRSEQKMWRQVEAKMRIEAEEAEKVAMYEQRKAMERERAISPGAANINAAWESLGLQNESSSNQPNESIPSISFQHDSEDKNALHRATDGADSVEDGMVVDDLLAVDDLVSVRQDSGVNPAPEAPDWELIEKLSSIATREDVETPDVPSAPDLPVVEDELETEGGIASQLEEMKDDEQPSSQDSADQSSQPPDHPEHQENSDPNDQLSSSDEDEFDHDETASEAEPESSDIDTVEHDERQIEAKLESNDVDAGEHDERQIEAKLESNDVDADEHDETKSEHQLEGLNTDEQPNDAPLTNQTHSTQQPTGTPTDSDTWGKATSDDPWSDASW